jgi:hypothetical protein
MRGVLLAPLMARNLYKSNVSWSSYPFLPPTTASGFLASLVEGERWYEGDFPARYLLHLAGWEDVWSLGAYPRDGNFSRLHFRAHVKDLFNYEAYIWSAGQGVGKKPATVEEFLTEQLHFVVVSPARQKLVNLHETLRGRLAAVAKKGSIQMGFRAEPEILQAEATSATGNERTLALVPVEEIGSFPREAQPYYVPLSAVSIGGQVQWHAHHCLWEEDLRFRKGVQILKVKGQDQGISAWLLQNVQ